MTEATVARPRKELINLDSTPYYHVMSRCVRRTFLCGIDKETGQDYSHRKQWIVDRVKYLAKIFAMDIAAYAVMSNHYHLVLHVDKHRAIDWSDEEVLARYKMLHRKKAEEIEDIAKLNPNHPQIAQAYELWRGRLMDISWFMKCMNEPIARQSNTEEECKGHFWEGRFKSQALLDQGAILSAMVYVDLNPIRAKMSSSPEQSDFTSIKERIESYRKAQNCPSTQAKPQPSSLMHFDDDSAVNTKRNNIQFKLEDYIKLVDETGRMMRNDKRGFIPKALGPLLSRLDLKPSGWLNITKHLESLYAHVIGSEDVLIKYVQLLSPPKGVRTSRALYCK